MLQTSISPHPQEQCWVIFFSFLAGPFSCGSPNFAFWGKGAWGLGGAPVRCDIFFVPGWSH